MREYDEEVDLEALDTGSSGDLCRFNSDGKVSWGRLFTDEQCDAIVRQVTSIGKVDYGTQLSGGARIEAWAFDATLVRVDENLSLIDSLWSAFGACNHLGLTIEGLEVIRFLRYTSGTDLPKHADWSPDTAPLRKLSLTVQLSSPESYEGGDLVLDNHGTHTDLFGQATFHVPRMKGTCAVWPAWTIHMVTPVVSGERYALVSWASGPRLS